MTLETLRAEQIKLAKQLDDCETKDFTMIAAQLFQLGKQICQLRLEQEGER
jgi:hypothetical protein